MTKQCYACHSRAFLKRRANGRYRCIVLKRCLRRIDKAGRNDPFYRSWAK